MTLPRKVGLFLLGFLALGFGVLFLAVAAFDIRKATQVTDASSLIVGALVFLLGAVTLGFVLAAAALQLGRRDPAPFYMPMTLRILLGASALAFIVAFTLSGSGVIGGLLP